MENELTGEGRAETARANGVEFIRCELVVAMHTRGTQGHNVHVN